jgi:hypothetical protein
MTVQDMLDNLGLRLEDPDKKLYPESFKLQCLENAQLVMASLLPNDLLTNLEVTDTNDTPSSGKVALSSLTYDVLKGIMGIIAVKDYTGLWCNPVGLKDLKKTENSFHASSTQNPMYYLFANGIWPLPTTLVIDTYYLKMPKPLRHAFTMVADNPLSTTTFIGNASQGLSAEADVYNGAVIYSIATNKYHVITDYAVTTRTFTVSPDRDGATTWSTADTFYFVTHDYFLMNLANVTCELDVSYHDTIVTLAEVECWLRKGAIDRASAALQTGYDNIQTIIARREVITGIGEE